MLLSEAMRKGAAMRPQITGVYINSAGSCALGAAMEGAGLRWDEMCWFAARRRWPQISTALTPCPKCEEWADGYVIETAVHLNDDHHEPRERIADWLEGMGL